MKALTLLRQKNWLAGVSLLFLFPGFFLCHAAVTFHLMPDIFGGYWGQVTIALGFPLLASQFLTGVNKLEGSNKIDHLFFVTVTYMAIWITANFFGGTGEQNNLSYLSYCFKCIYYWVVVYVLFRNICLESKWLVRALWLSASVMLVIAVSHAQGQFFNAANISDSDSNAVTYQGYARSAVVVGVLLMAVSTGIRGQLAMVFSAVLLYYLGARAEFAGFLIISSLVMIAREGFSRSAFLWVPLACISFALLVVYGDVLDSNSRMLMLLHYGQGRSDFGRAMYLANAWKTIQHNVVFGDYASEVARTGFGSYSHNALSAWVTYGIAGFMLFCTLLIYTLWASSRIIVAKRTIATKPSALQIAAFGFAIYGVIEAIFAKPVFDPQFAIAWGLLSGVMQISRRIDAIGKSARKNCKVVGFMQRPLPPSL